MKTTARMALMALAVVAGVTSADAAPKQFYMATVPGNSQFGVDTGVPFAAGQTVSVKASGWVTLLNSQPMPFKPNPDTNAGYYSPDGAGSENDYLAPSCPKGSLIGYIIWGSFHCLGKSATFEADGGGDLFLLENDAYGDYGDNLGSFDALIQAP